MTVERALALLPGPESLEADRLRARDDFRTYLVDRAADQVRRYSDHFALALALVEDLMARSEDLRSLGTMRATLADVRVARFFVAGDALSADDLDLIGMAAPRRERATPQLAFISSFLDPLRFPWLAGNHGPTAEQRQAAARWTAGMMASARTATSRRMETSVRQEALAKLAVEAAGYTLSSGSLNPGEYGNETKIAGIKADVPVRLRNGRLLLLEAKVSGSEVNSYKRLNHEVTDKLTKWQAAEPGALVGAVLAGVFSAGALVAAHQAGVLLFWEHDLDLLTRFIRTADQA